jgi:uncharacterized protein (TIGR03086 family)
MPPAAHLARLRGADLLGNDPAAAYAQSSTALQDAFTRPGVMEQTFEAPIGTVPGAVMLHLRITEMLVHGWDLARATGQPADLPADLAEQELAFTRGALGSLPPDRRPFAAPVAVADEAPALDQLAAVLGRHVTG